MICQPVPQVRLLDLCQRISSGGTPSRKRPEYFCDSETGHFWVKSQELTDKDIYFTGERISDQGLKNSSAKYFPEGTVLIAMYGATVGKLGYLRIAATVNQAICGLEVDRSRADSRYVFYALRHTREALTSQAMGAAQQNLNQDLIRNFEIPLPELQVQYRIGSTLSAFDELIENNARRIEILEEMAQAIYREWFVEFRYPGHEDVPLVDSELGPIPEGWELRSASEALDISPSTRIAKDSLNPFVPMTSVSGSHMQVHPVELKLGNSGAKFRNGDTLFARITPCLENGKTAYVQFLDHDQVGFGSTELIVLRGKEVGPEFTYLLARSEDFRGNAIASMSGATGRQRVRNECFDTFRLAVPPSSIANLFSESVRPMFKLSNEIFKANVVLRETRDLLLPKFISGEIDVSELAIELVGSSV